jgi:hypothetical protein
MSHLPLLDSQESAGEKPEADNREPCAQDKRQDGRHELRDHDTGRACVSGSDSTMPGYCNKRPAKHPIHPCRLRDLFGPGTLFLGIATNHPGGGFYMGNKLKNLDLFPDNGNSPGKGPNGNQLKQPPGPNGAHRRGGSNATVRANTVL